MVRRKTAKRRVRRGIRKVGYKKCIISTMKRTKFSTPKMARKVFARAAKKCRAKMLGHVVRRKTRKVKRRKARRARR